MSATINMHRMTAGNSVQQRTHGLVVSNPIRFTLIPSMVSRASREFSLEQFSTNFARESATRRER